ncbi:TetR/AcrR family transcriptional regulator [Allobranchiibius sp. CTAmp26]|uniref:TetR/AcrR family transcriptional regulator n=1 Tax=Allobranchiibius sp. CTAmp26 TaxID=2815214 RepID=UPI001AA0B8C9|nr:TetR/AcrR family transcriptional regulator [Allobranchiibius sp. CTAmp26]MBO1756942.1 TetR/AcrR family transcriptional regulator [Allobranchiibius sp. CTAmp26]
MPRISQQHKELNRARIVAAASEGFRARGLDGVGIDELMKTAGMTHGGFYNHFGSKEDLALEVLHQGFADSLRDLARIVEAHPRSARAGLQAILDTYLSTDHRDHPELGCASAALAVDAARHGVQTQTEYQRGLDGYLAAITDLLLAAATQTGTKLDLAKARQEAIAIFSQLVGAQIIARAVARSDSTLSDEVLAATRKHLWRA